MKKTIGIVSIMAALVVLLGINLENASASDQIAQTPLLGKSVPKYIEPLPTFAGNRASGTSLTVSMEEFQQQVLPASFYATLPAPFNAGTYVWGYNIDSAGPSYPARTVEAQRGNPTTVTYINNLVGPGGSPPVLQKYLTVDQTIHWADPLNLMCMFMTTSDQIAAGCFQPFAGPVPTVVHLHGAEVPSLFDGVPEQWFTPDGIHGAAYESLFPVPGNEAVYQYPNTQEATTLWFHDHALGSTRLNVYSGLAGFYFLRDSRDTGLPTNSIGLPGGENEIELLIQDRQFDTNGQLLFPDGAPAGLNGPPTNPSIHPFWIPEFFGDVMVVNGKSWPYLNVEPKRYRFRILNASNARMIDLAIRDTSKAPKPGPTIWQIGTDGGFLDAPVAIALPQRLFLAPAERADVIVDFSGFAGKTLILDNSAKAPFPSGAPADPQTVGQIMQFRVSSGTASDSTCNPATNGCDLRGSNPIVRLAKDGKITDGVVVDKKRQLVLKEIEGPGGPIEVLLNNSRWTGLKESTLTSGSPQPLTDSTLVVDTYVTELPRVGATEEWEIINTTADAHPIHIHLIQFQAINSQPYQAGAYAKDWEAAFPNGFNPGDGTPFDYSNDNNPTIPAGSNIVGGNIWVDPYLKGKPAPPSPSRAGWKDTFVMLPGEVTRIAVRWAPIDTPVGDAGAGVNLFTFDPTIGPGYVWHCHILDHEDNEMMRPYAVVP